MNTLKLICSLCLLVVLLFPWKTVSGETFPPELTINYSTLDYTNWPWEGTPAEDSMNAAVWETVSDLANPGPTSCESSTWNVCDTIRIHWISPPEWDSITETYHITKVYEVNLAGYKDTGPTGASVCDTIWIHFKRSSESGEQVYCITKKYHVARIGECVEGGPDDYSLRLVPITDVPSLTEYGLIGLAIMLIVAAVWLIRRRKANVPA